MMALVIDRMSNRSNALARRLTNAGDAKVFVRTTDSRGDWRLFQLIGDGFLAVDAAPPARLVLHHYRDADQRTNIADGGVEVWYGGAGAELAQGKVHNVHVLLRNADDVDKVPREWLKELVDWARLEPDARTTAPVPRLLKRPAPDALLAYHLLSLLPAGERLATVEIKQAALKEAREIGGAQTTLNESSIDDAKARGDFLRTRC